MTRELMELQEKATEIDQLAQKLGEICIDEFFHRHAEDIGYGIVHALNRCETENQLDFADEVVVAAFGMNIGEMIKLVEKRDAGGFVWEGTY